MLPTTFLILAIVPICGSALSIYFSDVNSLLDDRELLESTNYLSAEQIADLYARVSGLPPLLREGILF